MKHALTLSVAILVGISLQAQPILQAGDISATGFSMPMYLVVDAGSSNPAPDGPNVTWDFTSAQLQLIGTAFMGSPTGTPHAAQFPTANWSVTQDMFGITQRYSYFKYTDTELELLSDNIPAEEANIFTNPKKILQFPFSFTNSFSDTFQEEDGVPTTITWAYSAYGTILSDLGIDQNIVKTVSNQNEIVFWKKTPLHPFIIINPAGILVLSSNPIGIQETSAAVRPSLYPNPVNDVVHLADALPGIRYALHDALGRTILEGSIQDRSISTIGVGHLANGNYQMRIWNEHSTTVLPLIKQ